MSIGVLRVIEVAMAGGVRSRVSPIPLVSEGAVVRVHGIMRAVHVSGAGLPPGLELNPGSTSLLEGSHRRRDGRGGETVFALNRGRSAPFTKRLIRARPILALPDLIALFLRPRRFGLPHGIMPWPPAHDSRCEP